jgi:hypothetical protein
MTASYSYRWAEGIVTSLEGKYPRASMIVYKSLDINTRNMVALLATNDPAFPLVRDLVHKVARMCEMPGNTLTDDEYSFVLQRQVAKWHYERLQKRLDQVRNFGMLFEQS